MKAVRLPRREAWPEQKGARVGRLFQREQATEKSVSCILRKKSETLNSVRCLINQKLTYYEQFKAYTFRDLRFCGGVHRTTGHSCPAWRWRRSFWRRPFRFDGNARRFDGNARGRNMEWTALGRQQLAWWKQLARRQQLARQQLERPPSPQWQRCH